MTSHTPRQTSTEALLGDVANEFFKRLADGEHSDVEAYAQRYPQIAEQIRLAFPALAMVGDSLSSTGRSTPESPISGDSGNKQLGDFRLVRELGRGGMGVVYEAEQVSLSRRVALKVLPFAGLVQEKGLARFHNEVRAAASLDHPNIVSVYSVGEDRGVHYYAMQLIRGKTLAEVIQAVARQGQGGSPLTDDSIQTILSAAHSPGARPGPTERWPAADDPPESQAAATESVLQAEISTMRPATEFCRSAARLAIQAAEALQHAHDHGILHRDIKPGNLLLDAQMQLYVTDFGLARIEADAGVTMTGDLLGTLRYMSPEQGLAQRVVIDHRSDIYSLGATLYELLTLRPAFDATDRHELLKQIAFEQPPRMRRINRSIPYELETIVLKAIEKNPTERYASAQELADDLQRYLDHIPIKAKPPGVVNRFTKWSVRHHRLVLGTSFCSAVVAVVALVSALLINSSYRKLDRQRRDIVDAYRLSATLRQRRIGSTGGLLSPRRMVFGRDGTLYVSSASNNSILTFSAASGEFLQELVPKGKGGLDRPIGMALSEDGILYVASADNNCVLRYSDEDGAFLGEHVLAGASGLSRPSDIVFSDDGWLYVTSDSNPTSGQILRFHADTGQFHDVFVDHVAWPRGLMLQEDGSFYVCSYLDHQVLRLRSNGEPDATFVSEEHELLRNPVAIAFGRDGQMYVGCDTTSCIIKLDSRSGNFIETLVQPGSGGLQGVADFAFRDDGLLYICSRNTNEILRYDSRTGAFVDEFVSNKLSRATPVELLLLAITFWHLDERDEAQSQYQRAVEQLPDEQSMDPELRRLLRQAETLIDSDSR